MHLIFNRSQAETRVYKTLVDSMCWDVPYFRRLDVLFEQIKKDFGRRYRIFLWLVENDDILEPFRQLNSESEYDMLRDVAETFFVGNSDLETNKKNCFMKIRDGAGRVCGMVYVERKKTFLGNMPYESTQKICSFVSRMIRALEPTRRCEKMAKTNEAPFVKLPDVMNLLIDESRLDGILVKVEPLKANGFLNRDLKGGYVFFQRLLEEWKKAFYNLFGTSASFWAGYGCTMVVEIVAERHGVLTKLKELYETNCELSVPFIQNGRQQRISWPVAFEILEPEYQSKADFLFSRNEHEQGMYLFGQEGNVCNKETFATDTKSEEHPVMSNGKENAIEATPKQTRPPENRRRRRKNKDTTDEKQLTIADML